MTRWMLIRPFPMHDGNGRIHVESMVDHQRMHVDEHPDAFPKIPVTAGRTLANGMMPRLVSLPHVLDRRVRCLQGFDVRPSRRVWCRDQGHNRAFVTGFRLHHR